MRELCRAGVRTGAIEERACRGLPYALTRPRLDHLMNGYRRRAAVWVLGPPGIGKTTLVAGYIRDAAQPSGDFVRLLRVAIQEIPRSVDVVAISLVDSASRRSDFLPPLRRLRIR
jgi:KaiC/GvpD/RAD55 family RecA-like ATPase